MNLEIVRIETGKDGTFGTLQINGHLKFLTLEPEWNNNKSDISCIPEGEYKCEMVNSPRFGKTLKVLDVPGRTDILFHVGNFKRDTHGCILLGLEVGDRAILKSSLAMIRFRKIIQDVKNITLTISSKTTPRQG